MRTRFARRCAGIAMWVASATTLAACGGSTPDDGKPIVVASTNVWGDIATVIAGPDATVRALITDRYADPHSHETSAVESAALRDADLVVYNGGGYDEFAEKAVADTSTRVVNAFAVRADKSDDNEHVWYDMNTVDVVAERIATQLGELDPDHAAAYTERAQAFRNQLTDIAAITGKLAAEQPGTPVLQTEPLAYYLLRAAGAEDLTPHEFQEAIEQETDPAPAAFAATRDLLTDKRVRVLVFNAQTSDKITEELRDIASDAGIAIVEVTETIPEGMDYLQWQTANAQAFAAAVS
ncbi:metal ABC transporter solute-binding protein, Zn/Mn family [Nocardia sp. 004]|uniref:metal ABC transporter solute-binding protein, Zn/Mn family n=1 Tax=Nocardia sp. 004 TaxID=3385978 RepID=UPI0039A34CA8